jgi:hypothetical protein
MRKWCAAPLPFVLTSTGWWGQRSSWGSFWIISRHRKRAAATVAHLQHQSGCCGSTRMRCSLITPLACSTSFRRRLMYILWYTPVPKVHCPCPDPVFFVYDTSVPICCPPTRHLLWSTHTQASNGGSLAFNSGAMLLRRHPWTVKFLQVSLRYQIPLST